MPQNTDIHRVPQQSLGDAPFHAFKEIYVQSLAETSVATYDKKYKLYKISPEKSLNKQTKNNW